MNNNDAEKNADLQDGKEITRRDFLKFSAGTFGAISLSSLTFGCGGGNSTIRSYPIDPNVYTTLQRMISFPASLTDSNGAPYLAPDQLREVSQYAKYGYGNWTFGAPLPLVQRTARMMPFGYSNPSPTRKTKLLNFFAFSDIHITDKEAPNQLAYFQKFGPSHQSSNTSIYSPVMMTTTHVLDAAMQTANVLHKQNPFDFGISLGDTCNSTSYNELRWYIDVIDGKVITPSSGANLGADRIDYQRPYQAVGLDKSIPWYQVLGNHDHFYLGSFPVDANPALGFRQSYISDSVWAIGNVFEATEPFPIMLNMENMLKTPAYYNGLLDGNTVDGYVIDSGVTTDPAFAGGAPKIVADPNRRSLVRSDWVQEFFKTTTTPVGHGLNLVDPAMASDGFACYSFVPKAQIPLKVIVLDDTRSEKDGATDIHGHGFLDAKRWAWLQAELAQGQANNQLMIIAAHVPIGVAAIGAMTEWLEPTAAQITDPQYKNAVGLTDLVNTLQNTPNLLMWIAGHRHQNTVKAFPSADSSKPEHGFWQVETSALRDFPQQFRTFEIYLNSDYTVSIVTVNVDPSVAEGTPAAYARRNAIAAQQIVQNNVQPNFQNFLTYKGSGQGPTLPTMDPTRPQTDQLNPPVPDPNIEYANPSPVPVNGSNNAELFKQLSPQMIAVLKTLFP